MSVTVRKADGSVEPFKVDKLRNSLRRAGASKEEIRAVVLDVEAILHPHISTQEIYRHAFYLLQNTDSSTRARYSLRRALFNLGPTGFPFEDFLSKLFAEEGYTTDTGVTLDGSCVQHEIDVTAYNDNESFVAEAKFHARPGIKSDLQVAMYSYARFLDLQSQKICTQDVCGISRFILITNTKFTSTARRYAACVGIDLLSWDYPKKNNLQDRIEATGIYPVTALQNLSTAQKRILLEHKIILCKDILNNHAVLDMLHLNEKKRAAVMNEIHLLLA